MCKATPEVRPLYSSYMLFGWNFGYRDPPLPYPWYFQIGAFALKVKFTQFNSTFVGIFTCTEPGFICGFVDTAGGDFNLTESSDAIDNGSSIYAPSVDYFGLLRPKGLRIDIGAVESSFTSGSEPSGDEGDDRPSFPYNGDPYWDDPIVDDEGDDWDIDSSLSLFDFSKWSIDDEALQFPGIGLSNEQIFFLVVGVVCSIVLLIGLLKIV